MYTGLMGMCSGGHQGRGLKAVLPGLEGQILSDAFEMKRPNLPLTWESITHHENCVFELGSTSLIARDSVTMGCPLAYQSRQSSSEDETLSCPVDRAPPPDKEGTQHSLRSGIIEDDGDSSEGEAHRQRQKEVKKSLVPAHPWLIKPPGDTRMQINKSTLKYSGIHTIPSTILVFLI
nr:uncharacterized protein LOC129268549 [Lytechinus pictus]